MLPRSSSTLPITKQLNNVTRRPVPAPAKIRPAGRKRKSSSAWENRTSHRSGSFSGAASARATRRQLSSIVTSIGVPSWAFIRYLASQICREIGAILIAMPAASGSRPRQSPDRGPGVVGAGSSAVMYISIVLSWSSVCPSPSARDAGRGKGAAAGARARRTLAAAGGAWHLSRPLFCDALLCRLSRVQCRSEPLQQFGGIESVDPSAHWQWRYARLVQPAGDPMPVGNVVEEQ